MMRKQIIIVLCFLMVFVCLGFCGTTKSIYLVPITDALGIQRSTFSLTDSIQYITTAIVNLFFGTLISKFGTKKLIITGFLSLIISMLCYAGANQVWGFYIGSIFLGIGLSWTTTTMVGCIIGEWCKEKQGAIMGAVLAANGLGGALATQIVSPMIYREGDSFGYRDSYKFIAMLILILGLMFMLLYKEKSSVDGMGERKNFKKAVVKEEQSRKYGGDTEVFRGVIREPYFWVSIVCIFLAGGILQGIASVFPAHMKDIGLNEAYVVSVVSINSLILAATKFFTGLVYDKFGLRFVTNTCYIAAGTTLLLLIFLTDTSGGMVSAMIFAVTFAIALPLQTVMLPLFSSDLFNRRAYNIILGLLVSANTAGYAFCIPSMNWVFDICGSYKPVFIVCGLIMAAVMLCFQYVIRVSKQKQR